MKKTMINKNLQLVENRFGDIVPLMKFEISMTEKQIEYLLGLIDNDDFDNPWLNNHHTKGFNLRNSGNSIRKTLEETKDYLKDFNEFILFIKENPSIRPYILSMIEKIKDEESNNKSYIEFMKYGNPSDL